MKKRIVVSIIILLFMTGCTCEYNLQIEDNVYKEQIKLQSNDEKEVALFNQSWEISSNKNKNVPGGDPSTTKTTTDDTYKYNLSNNILTFNYDFSQNEYSNSSAVAKCYSSFTVTNYQNSTIISTPLKSVCFDNYPSLSEITVKISTDKKVISSSADNLSGNTYIWKLNKNNVSSKSINLVIDNSEEKASSGSSPTNPSTPIDNKAENEKDYTLYIFLGILLIMFSIGYFIVQIIKKKGDSNDI